MTPPLTADPSHSPDMNGSASGGTDVGSWRRNDQSIGFLVSLVLHLVLLIVLGLIVQQGPTQSSPLTVRIVPRSNSIDFLSLVDLAPLPAVSELAMPQSNALTDKPVEVDLLDAPDLLPDSMFPMPAPTESQQAVAVTDPTTPSQRNGNDSRPDGVRFFDTHAYGNRFVYVLDISGSMSAGNGRRMQRARAELIRSINQLQPHQRFHVILYNNLTYNMPGGIRLRPATKENKYLVARWIMNVQPSGGTMPGEALRIAGQLHPDAVFFLSDGEFVFGGESTMQSELDRFLLSFAQARPGVIHGHPLGNNSFPKSILENYPDGTIVHTVAFESPQSKQIMQTIAESKGGEFRYIPPPRGG